MARYIHLENINGQTFRLSTFVDAKGVEEFLSWLQGRNAVLCESVVEGGYSVRKSTPVDELGRDQRSLPGQDAGGQLAPTADVIARKGRA